MKKLRVNIDWFRRNERKKIKRFHRKKSGKKGNGAKASEDIFINFNFFFLDAPKHTVNRVIQSVNEACNDGRALGLSQATKLDIAAITYAAAWLGKSSLKATSMSQVSQYLSRVLAGANNKRELVPVTKIAVKELDLNNAIPSAVVEKMLLAYSLEDDGSRQKFSIALMEACNNIHDHSSAEAVYFASYQDTGIKAFVVYDNGVGIPETIKSKVTETRMQDFLSKFSMVDTFHERCLRAAIDDTRTEFSYRGQGLGDIIASIDNSSNNDSRLVIMSGLAILNYYKRKPIETKAITENIKGTLLYWII